MVSKEEITLDEVYCKEIASPQKSVGVRKDRLLFESDQGIMEKGYEIIFF